jgi:hypothetical protein
MLKKAIIRELIWIGAFLLVSILVVRWMAGFAAGDSIDIQIHDTYFIISGNPITHALWIWISLILIKYLLQGLLLLAKQNIVIASVLALILLLVLSRTMLGMVQSYSDMHAAIPGEDDPFIGHMRRINFIGFIFYAIISAGLLTLLILMIKEIIRKIQMLTTGR